MAHLFPSQYCSLYADYHPFHINLPAEIGQRPAATMPWMAVLAPALMPL
jgi:hypothetical protein